MANTFEIFLKTYGLEAANKGFGQLGGALQSIQEGFGRITGALAAAGVTSVLRSMWMAAEEARVATFRLETALKSTGQAAAGFAESMAAQAETLESLTGVSDETTMGVQSLLLTMGASIEQVQELTPVVLDLAAAMGMDALTAARQLGQALDGQEIQVGRLNIKVSSFEELVGVLNQRVRGQAQALLQARGPAAELGVELGRLSETLGELLSMGASPGLGWIASSLRASNEAVASLRWLANAGDNLSAMFDGATQARPAVRGGGVGGFDEEAAAIEAERARQTAAAQELMRVEAELNNQYAFRRALIEQDPNLSETERRQGLLSVLREEVMVQQQLEAIKRADYERALTIDPARNLETTIEAETALGDAQLRRLQIQQQIQSIEDSGTFGGRLRQQVRGLADEYGNLAVSMANVSFNTVTQGVQGLAGALTAVIMQTQTAGQAFAQFGLSLLTNFISTVLSAVLYATVAIPILTALGVVSGGATAATGAGVTTAALAMGAAAASSATAGFYGGGYTGSGPATQVAGPVHLGEWVVPAWRTAQIGIPALEQMTFGGGDTPRGETPIQVVILDDRNNVDELRRNPRFRTLVVDLANGA